MPLRKATLADAPRLAGLHLEAWDPAEISCRLGPEFLEMFYTNIATSSNGFGYLHEVDGEVIGYATGFSDYDAFNAELRTPRLAALMLGRLVTRRLRVRDLLNLVRDGEKTRRSRYPRHHLGALAVAPRFRGTDAGREAVRGSIQGVLDQLAARGLPGCWGLTDATNQPMRRYLLKFGFVEVTTIPLRGRSVVLYDRTFAPAG